jgi:hypothetical protein
MLGIGAAGGIIQNTTHEVYNYNTGLNDEEYRSLPYWVTFSLLVIGLGGGPLLGLYFWYKLWRVKS